MEFLDTITKKSTKKQVAKTWNCGFCSVTKPSAQIWTCLFTVWHQTSLKAKPFNCILSLSLIKDPS